MKTQSFLNIVLAAALVCVSVRLVTQASTEQPAGNSAAATVYDNILSRASVRSYTDQKVEAGKVDSLLHAGMAAPSAVNRQPWRFVVVEDTTTLNAIAEITPNARMAASAPLAIVVCGDMSVYSDDEQMLRQFWVQDASAATENILLAAHALGLGAVWTGTYPDEKRCAAVAELLSLPENVTPLCTIVIGYPTEQPEAKDKWNAENVSYKRFGQHK